ncbi:cation-dependent mannose-6-phosphate receptor-like [Acanthaster planci]|uniref:Cation-dependent mannose-6-phosphate receptor-like n=1 Tax=Acanthaster planci TaxID=133434 RepID=A0A8B7XFY0_ACAPL|nr:cation-dependent mannose-6-phosphate receptor-like [Acanthaster planci]
MVFYHKSFSIMKLSKTNTVALISCVCLIGMCYAAVPKCTKIDDCSCRIPDGKEINIRSLGYNGNRAPRFGFEQAGAWKYAYNPCYAWTASSKCQGVVACQQGIDSLSEFPIGDPSATWKDDGINYNIEYSSVGDDKKTRTSVVKLVCDENAEEPVLQRHGSRQQSPVTYDFTLTSKCACLGICQSEPTNLPGLQDGLSPGSVLCIIVSVLIVVYLVAGVLFMKFARHAEGTDLIPNRDIWIVLFCSIRDGCIFIFTCGKKSGYDGMK